MSVYDEAADSTRAAQLMHEQGVACLIVIGGDGTNRVVAKGCESMPLIPLSTGTNNAFPRFLESTLAGLAAGYYAARRFSKEEFTSPTKRFNLYRNEHFEDVALIDVAVCDYQLLAHGHGEVNLEKLFSPRDNRRTSHGPIGGIVHPSARKTTGTVSATRWHWPHDYRPIAPGPTADRCSQPCSSHHRLAYPISFAPSISL
jgi:hypothetical protein